MIRRFPVRLLLLLLAAILPHVGALGGAFVFDDRGVIVENPAVTGFDLGAIWSSPYWPGNPGAGLYRPLTSLSYAVDWALGGGSPTLFLLLNILLHAAVTLAALGLLRRLFPNRTGLTWAAAFLFAVHPIHVEVVAGIVGRAEILSALFALLAYRLWLQTEEEGCRRGVRLLSPLLWLLALLSKEGAIALPVLLLTHRFGLLPPRLAARRLRTSDLAWPAALLLALVLRVAALGRLTTPRASWIDNPLASLDPIRRALGACGVLARQLGQIVTGQGYSPDYSYAEVAPGAGLYLLGAPVLLLLSAGLLALLRRGRRSPAGWGFAFFLAFWLVTSNLVVPIGTVQADRLLYLPLLGLLVLAVAALSRIDVRAPGRWLPVLLVLLVVRFGIASGLRVRDWRDDGTLFAAAVREAPRSVKARANLAAVLLRDETAATARRVLELIEPVREDGKSYGPLIQREAKARMFLGELERARVLYRAALAAGTDSAEVLIELGNLALLAEDGAEALAAFEAAGRTGRKPEHVAIGRASALSLLGRYGESADRWLAIFAALPDSVPVLAACAWNLREAGRAREAASLLREGLTRRDDPRLWDGLARALLAGGGTAAEALEAARRAVLLAPSGEHRTTLALAFIATGGQEEARRLREEIVEPELREEIDRALEGSGPASSR